MIEILRKIIFRFLPVFMLFICVTVQGQNLSGVKVDNLSDDQIRQYIQRAEDVGYTAAQIDQVAAAQGMPASEISKLKMRVEKLQNTPSKAQGRTGGSTGRPTSVTRQYDRGNRQENQFKSDTTQWGGQSNMSNQQGLDSTFNVLKPKVFGAELFRNANITFEPDLRMATPRDYVIGPDDQLIIDITGDNVASYTLPVNTDGSINVEYVGLVNVSGLSVEAATDKIRNRLASTYSGIRSGRTQLTVNLGNIRSIRVVMTGAVTRPGTYTLPSLASVYNALYAAGGPAENGSFREIQVLRGSKVITTIDVYDFLVRGAQSGNIRLQDQDVIHIPVFANRVEVAGQVKRPALFETVTNESLADLLQYAGGFAADAYTAKVQVYSNTSRERRIEDILANEFGTYQPKNGDHFMVGTLLDRYENRIEIDGAVFMPGVYGLRPGMSLQDLLQQAQGLREDAFMERGLITRLKPDNSLQIIHFNPREVVAGTQQIALMREDKITISSIFDLRDEFKLTVQGEVREPGDFEFGDDMRLSDVIQLSGGLKEGSANSRIEIARRNRGSRSVDSTRTEVFVVQLDGMDILPEDNYTLQPYDVITVLGNSTYRLQRQVKIEGEVRYPGIYTITREDEKILDIIARAGGLTDYAYVEGASLRRTGISSITNKEVKDQDKKRSDNDEDEEDLAAGFAGRAHVGQRDITGTSTVDRSALLRSVAEEEVELKEASDLVGIRLDKIFDNPGIRENLLVLDGDVITVPKELQTVKVSGEVLNPNMIVYRKGKSLGYYIEQAGGFAQQAQKKKTFVQYANGSVKGTGLFYPEVRPGAEIIVPRKPQRERLNAQGWIGLGTGVASLAAIIVSLLR